MELIRFGTPEAELTLNGVAVEIVWDDGLSSIVSSVHIIVDEKCSEVFGILSNPDHPDHPEHDEWFAWDENIFYYCESIAEWNDILANGHHDGWRVIQ
jgi:hypothetical protein